MLDILELYDKPANYKFSDIEIEFIKKHCPIYKFKAKYAIYKKKSKKGKQIGFFIDQIPCQHRKSGVENHWEFITERKLTKLEYEEMIHNFGTNTRRFIVWMYDNIESLIQDDLKCNIDTPQEFIDECKKRGLSGIYQQSFQF